MLTIVVRVTVRLEKGRHAILTERQGEVLRADEEKSLDFPKVKGSGFSNRVINYIQKEESTVSGQRKYCKMYAQ